MTTQIKFTQELKDKWLKALRSGEYSQTSCTLKDSDGFCCLGVLCDVIDPNGWISHEEYQELDSDQSGDWSLHSHGKYIYGREFCKLYNHKTKTSEYIYEEFEDLLPVDYSEFANRNDGEDGFPEHDFDMMADWIEKNVPAQG